MDHGDERERTTDDVSKGSLATSKPGAGLSLSLLGQGWGVPDDGATLATGGRYPLPGPDFHRLDRASFAWRTQSHAPDRGAGTSLMLRLPQGPPPEHEALWRSLGVGAPSALTMRDLG